MWQLHQFPLCPFSRKVRLLLGEKSVAYELVRESPWDQRDEFLDMNPAGRTPVMKQAQRGIVLADSMAICEYVEETVEKAPMINGTATNRAEIRRSGPGAEWVAVTVQSASSELQAASDIRQP